MKLYDLRLNHKFKTIEYFNEIGILMAISVMQAQNLTFESYKMKRYIQLIKRQGELNEKFILKTIKKIKKLIETSW